MTALCTLVGAAAATGVAGTAAAGSAVPTSSTATVTHVVPRLAAGLGGIVAAAPNAAGTGYWSAYSNGRVVAAGAASFVGDLAGTTLSAPIVAMTPTPDGGGYWLVASDGGVFSFGDAVFRGSTGGVALRQPIVGMTPTPDGGGYWLVASDGGVFSFGDAAFAGSTGNVALRHPVVGMAPAPDGHGYWLVGSDGGIFNFGSAPFEGSTGATSLGAPVVGVAAAPGGRGYWLLGSDGGVFNFGSAPFAGAASGALAGATAVNIAPVGAGYWVTDSEGVARTYGGPTPPPAAVAKVVASSVDPPDSAAPSAAFSQHCFSGESNAGCDQAALADIDAARANEGVAPLDLPANYGSLGVNGQLMAVTNAERTSRGLPPFSEAAALDGIAAAAAARTVDPTGPAGSTWFANLSSGYVTALAADYGWMYDDGVGSPNSTCTTAGSAACWGHRHAILAPWGGTAGAGGGLAAGSTVLTELFVAG